jgi:hypothetical protein
MRHLKAIAATVFVVAGLPVLLTGAVAATTPSRPNMIPQSSFQQIRIPDDFATPEPQALAVQPSSPTPEATSRIYETAGWPSAPAIRHTVKQPTVKAKITAIAKPRTKAKPKSFRTSHSIRGRASWYCKAGRSICMAKHPDRSGVADMYAAAGPSLRMAICGSSKSNCWRGRRVTVNGVGVTLADWCQCLGGQSGVEKAIDLYWDAWARVPGVTRGVTIRW